MPALCSDAAFQKLNHTEEPGHGKRLAVSVHCINNLVFQRMETKGVNYC